MPRGWCDVVHCWRVESIETPRHLRFTAEMKLPGRARLEFDVLPTAGGVILRQTATFDPVELWGLAYWYALYPLHEVMFSGIIRNLGRASTVPDEAPTIRLKRKIDKT